MAQIALNLGAGKAGLTDLRAQLLDSETTVTATVSTGFTELSDGQYVWTYTLPAGTAFVRFYSAADANDIYFTLAVASDRSIPDGSGGDIRVAYLYARDVDEVEGMVLYYQRIGVADGTGDGWDDSIHSVESDAYGLFEFETTVGSYYKYWLKSGRAKTFFVSEDTTDPFELEQTVG